MKRTVSIILLAAVALCCQSCRNFMYSHNPIMLTDGKYANVGVDGYGLTYADGLVVVGAMRENTELEIEINSGDKFEGAGAEMKGVRVIRYRTGPQLTGYARDIAGKDPDVIKEYVDKMPYLNKAQWGASDKQGDK